MERIIDISNKEGKLWAEDEGYLSDFAQEEGYLFSIATSINNRNTRIFHKDYFHNKNIFKGKYYITLADDYDGELHCTNDYNNHCEWNIENGGYFGDYVKRDYQDTIILDMDKITAICRNEEDDFLEIIKQDFLSTLSDREHENSYKQPY